MTLVSLRTKGAIPDSFYDSGVRLNLVTDYFELYFPVYSNRGWEIAQDNYGQRIRFIVTISPKTLYRALYQKMVLNYHILNS